MLIDSSASSSTDPATTIDDTTSGTDLPDLRLFVFGLFFAFGGITSLNDVIIPKLKGLFTLGYGQAMLVQSAFFAAYFVVSLPASAIVRRFGYLRTAALGLLTMTAGCLLFIPASASGRFPIFLVALFVLAAGITIVQVVSNPLISLLGPARTASSRLTFAQAFNSLGTAIFPYVGAILILGGLASVNPSTLDSAGLTLYRAAETRVIVHAYLGLAAALLLVAGAIWLRRNRLQEQPAAAIAPSPLQAFSLLRRPRFAFGTLSIFVYVGAEVTIGSLLVAWLTQQDVMAISAEAAGKHVFFYWGGAMVGRFIGAWLLRLVSPGKLLATVAAASIGLILVAANSAGPASGWALLAIGLCNSIMFPTIFSLASQGLGPRAAEGSGIICMAIVGGAILPPLTGHLADMMGLRLALAIPAACYLIVIMFGLFASRTTSR